MDFQRSRPNSARSQSRINPITGEDMALTSRADSGQGRTPRDTDGGRTQPNSRSHFSDSRPSGVPPLNLRGVIGRDDDMQDYTMAMDSPMLAAAAGRGVKMVHHMNTLQISGPPGSSRPQPAVSQPGVNRPPSHRPAVAQQMVPESSRPGPQKVKEPTAWDRQPVPENIRPPSQRHLEQYHQLKQEAVESYRRKAMPVSQRDVDREIENLRLNIPSDDNVLEDQVPQVEDRQDRLQASWNQAPYSKEALRKLQDKESVEEEKRKSKMLETVLIDQLCRPVISDPGQECLSSARPTSYRPGMKRGAVRTLHDTKVRTDGSSTENLLSRRVRFEARLLTLVGHDALRELTGFLFAADSSLTVYEFRQFGKTSKAMPFVKRGTYRRLRDQDEHSPAFYSLADITQGNNLVFETASQPVPDGVKTKPTMVLRICDVDEEAKKAVLLSAVSPNEKEDMWQRLHLPASARELKRRLLMRDVHEIVRRQISKRGIRVYTGIGRLLRHGDISEHGLMNKFELEKALIDFHIVIPQDKFDDLWDMVDPEETSFLEYDEFMRAFVGEMNELRKFYVIKAFTKMDPGKHGVVTFGDIMKFYNASKHPKVRSGECTEEEIAQMFLESFERPMVKGELMYREFEEYYEGLSLDIDADEDFCNILRNAWSI